MRNLLLTLISPGLVSPLCLQATTRVHSIELLRDDGANSFIPVFAKHSIFRTKPKQRPFIRDFVGSPLSYQLDKLHLQPDRGIARDQLRDQRGNILQGLFAGSCQPISLPQLRRNAAERKRRWRLGLMTIPVRS